MRRISLVLLLAACSHSAAPATNTTMTAASGGGGGSDPPPAASHCDQVSDHLVGLMSAKSVATPEQMDPFRKLIATRCSQDLWTAAAQQCFLGAASLDDADKCQPTLTQSQQDALQRDGNALVGQAGGAEGAAAPPKDEDKKDQRKTRGPAKPGGDPCEGGE